MVRSAYTPQAEIDVVLKRGWHRTLPIFRLAMSSFAFFLGHLMGRHSGRQTAPAWQQEELTKCWTRDVEQKDVRLHSDFGLYTLSLIPRVNRPRLAGFEHGFRVAVDLFSEPDSEGTTTELAG